MAILADDVELVDLLIKRGADIELGRTIHKDGMPFKLPLAAALCLTSKQIAVTNLIFKQYIKLRWINRQPMDELIPNHLYEPTKQIVFGVGNWDPVARPLVNTHVGFPHLIC